MRVSWQPQVQRVLSGSWWIRVRGQLRRQRCALGLLFRFRGGRLRLRLRQLGFDGGDVGIDQLIEQVSLHRIELFTAPGEAVALEQRQLVGQLLIERAVVLKLFEQIRGQLPQLVGGELLDVR
jgi:hypothetical protein